MSTEALARPVARAERIELLDILRGFALLGILLVNFWGSAGKLMPKVDGIVSTGLNYLISESFYPLYSFLFGLGFAIQLLRARESNASVVSTYFRRMLGLLLIGAVHLMLIRQGDILVNYALLGLLLIPLHRLPTRALPVLIVLLFAYRVAEVPIQTAIANWRDPAGQTLNVNVLRGWEAEERRVRDADASSLAAAPASYTNDVRTRWNVFANARVYYNSQWQNVIRTDLLLIFLIGLYAGKKRWFQNAATLRKQFGISALVGLALATAGVVYGLFDEGNNTVSNIAYNFANWGVTAFYVAGITFLVTAGGRAAQRLRIFAPAGMMGLTNYLLQSLVMTWPFLAYGLGLPRPTTTFWVLINLVFYFLVQVPVSAWWMKRYRFGPAEWLWRSMTYGELQPMRRDTSAAESAQPETLAVQHA